MVETFAVVQGEQFPPEGWTPNQTLPEVLIRAARKEIPWWAWRKKRAVLKVLNSNDFRFVLEAELTDIAMRSGQLPPTGTIAEYGNVPIFVGAWTDLFDWILTNWPAIMEMIMQIINLFAGGKISAETAVMMIAGLITLAQGAA
jgi:hypothetical protein